jgi:hypothetical protein
MGPIKELTDLLKNEPELYKSWVDVMATCFEQAYFSEYFQQSDQDENSVRRISKEAAENFLNILLR